MSRRREIWGPRRADPGVSQPSRRAPLARDAGLGSLSITGKVFVAGVVVAGLLALVAALAKLASGDVPSQWVILAALTLFSGIFAARIPAISATLSVSETLILGLVLLFGPAPAIATVAADGLIASARLRRWSVHRTLVNIAQPVLSVWCAATLFYALSSIDPFLLGRVVPIETVWLPLAALVTTYFAVHTLIGGMFGRIDSGRTFPEFLRTHLVHLGLNHAATFVLLVFFVRSAADVAALAVSASAIVLALIWLSYTSSKTYIAHVEGANRHLAELNELYRSTVETLAAAIDAKDQVTSGHTRRVQQSALRLAEELGVSEPGEIEALECASLLHDLGKLVVPEHILNKPGALSQTEFEQMKRHASIGAEILSKVRFPYPVEPIVRHHHENWDGSGYPDGLGGEAIPLGARILSVVDCFDALTSDRPYRRSLSRDEALEIVRSRRGTMYDPRVLDAFLDIYPELAVAQERKFDSPLEVPARDARHDDGPRGVERASETHPPFWPGRACRRDEGEDRHAGVLASFIDAVHRRADALPRDAVLVVYRWDSPTDTLRADCVSSAQHAWMSRLSIPVGDAVSGWVGANRRAVINAEPLSDFKRTGIDGTVFCSCVSAPIEADGHLVGVVTIYSSRPVSFNDGSEAIARALGEKAAPILAPVVVSSASTDSTERHLVSA